MYAAFCDYASYENKLQQALAERDEAVRRVDQTLLLCILFDFLLCLIFFNIYNCFFRTPKAVQCTEVQQNIYSIPPKSVQCAEVQQSIQSILPKAFQNVVVKQNNYSIRPKKTYEHTLCTYPGGSICLLEIKTPNPFYSLPLDVDDVIDKFLGRDFKSMHSRLLTSKKSAKLLSVARLRHTTSELQEMGSLISLMDYSTPLGSMKGFGRNFLRKLEFLILSLMQNPRGDYRGKRWKKAGLKALEAAESACASYRDKRHVYYSLSEIRDDFLEKQSCLQQLRKILSK